MAPKNSGKKGKAKAAAKPKEYDYSGLEKGMKLQAEIGGAYYSAEVVQVSKSKKWAKTPILVHWQGYGADTDEWVSGDRLKSKALKEKKEPKKEKKPKKEGEEKKPRGTAVLRLVSYKCKAGKEKEFKDLTDELAKSVATDIEGLLVFDYTWPDPTTFSAAMLFKSQELLDKYKAGVREKYLERMGPMLDGPPRYDTAGPLSRTFRNRKAKPEEGKAIMRLVAYKCKEGKEADWKKHMDGKLMKNWSKECEGYTVCRYGWSDEKTIFACMCFESQEAVDKYQTGLKEKYLEEMKDLMDGAPLFQDLGTDPQTISPSSTGKYFPKTVAEAWKNHFDAFGAQDLDKIMLDYDDDSVARLFNNVGEVKSEFKGASAIKGMFDSLFKDLKDLKTLKAPVIDVEEDGRQVFLVWMCPGCGYDTATDTFIFRKVKGQFKIARQNIVITKK